MCVCVWRGRAGGQGRRLAERGLLEGGQLLLAAVVGRDRALCPALCQTACRPLQLGAAWRLESSAAVGCCVVCLSSAPGPQAVRFTAEPSPISVAHLAAGSTCQQGAKGARYWAQHRAMLPLPW